MMTFVGKQKDVECKQNEEEEEEDEDDDDDDDDDDEATVPLYPGIGSVAIFRILLMFTDPYSSYGRFIFRLH